MVGDRLEQLYLCFSFFFIFLSSHLLLLPTYSHHSLTVVSLPCTCRLNTDVLFGKKFGMKTLAVLTGITNQQILDSASAELTPDYYANSIADATMART